MSGHLSPSRDEVRETVQELRGHLGLFSFQNDVPAVESRPRNGSLPELGVRPGGIVEWLVARAGRGCRYLGLANHVAILGRSWSLGGCGSRSGVLCPCFIRLGHRSEQNAGSPPGHSPGNVLGDRAMPAMSRCVGHLGLGRPADSRAGSSPLATGGGSGRRRGLVFSAGHGATGTRLGRLTIAGHAAGWRPGGNQTGAYRGAVSPGRPGRQRPGVGDRPCRGSCASGSRSGRSSDCGARGPSLDGRSSCCLPARISDLRSRSAVRRPNGWAFASVNRWPRPRRCCRKRSSFPPMSPRTVMPSVNWRSTVSASRLWSVWKRVLIPNRCSATSPAARISGMERNDFSRPFASYWRGRGYHIQLALAGIIGSGLGARSYRDHLAGAGGG